MFNTGKKDHIQQIFTHRSKKDYLRIHRTLNPQTHPLNHVWLFDGVMLAGFHVNCPHHWGQWLHVRDTGAQHELTAVLTDVSVTFFLIKPLLGAAQHSGIIFVLKSAPWSILGRFWTLDTQVYFNKGHANSSNFYSEAPVGPYEVWAKTPVRAWETIILYQKNWMKSFQILWMRPWL